MLDVELKEKWLAALRSGEYQQGRAVLKRGDNYCCLGVLCEISGLNGVWKPIDGIDNENPAEIYIVDNDDEYSTLLPKPLAAMIGEERQWDLAKLNDGSEGDVHDFNQIADWIERTL